MDEQLSEIVEECLERLDAGASIEECLAAYPQHLQELEELLNTMLKVQDYPWPAIPPITLAAIETRLLTELQTQQSNTNSLPTPAIAQPNLPRSKTLIDRLLQVAGFRGAMQPWQRLVAVTIGLVLALVLGTGALAAARAIINTIAPSPTPAPAITQITTGSTTIVTVAGTIQQMSQNTWVVRNTPISVDTQTKITGEPQIGAPVMVTGLLRDDGTILAQSITVMSLTPIISSPITTSVPIPTATQTSIPTSVPTTVSIQQPPTDLPAATLVSSPVGVGVPVITATITAIPAVVPSIVPTQPLLATSATATGTVLPSLIPTNTPPATATAVRSPTPTVTPVPTATSTPAFIATATQTTLPTPPPTTVPINTPVPTQLLLTTVPVVPTDAFEALRALIRAGIADGRAERPGGEFLLKKLDEAQEAAIAGNINQLENHLQTMKLKTDEELRTGKMDSSFGQQVLDGISAIATQYNIPLR